MKKVMILCVAILAAITVNVSCFAENYLFSAYGSKSYYNDFDLADTEQLTTYPYFISGKATVSVSDSVKRKGKSIAVNTQGLNTNDSEKVLFSFHPSASTTNPTKDDFYVEVYVKGFSQVPDNLIPYYEYNDGTTATISDYGCEPAENGWYKLWYTAPVIDDYIINGHTGWNYTKQSGDPTTIWFDDFSMRPIPGEIYLEKRSCTNLKDFDLSNISAYGYSSSGTRHNIENRKLIKWTVLSGDAYVESGKLKFYNHTPQEILLEADFFGVKSKVTLWASNYGNETSEYPILADIREENNQYIAEIENCTNEDTYVYLIVATYRNGMLYKINSCKETISALSTISLSCPIADVPEMLGGEITTDAFICTGKFGIEKFPISINK